MRNDDFSASAHGLRGIASMMVLVAHILGGTAEHVYADHPGYVGLVEHPWNLGVNGVELFFIISGFVIVPSALKYTAREFAARRFMRLYPLFLVSTIAFVLLNARTNAYPAANDPLTILAAPLFLDLFTGTEQLAPNAWSLSYEVFYYILTCALVHCLVKRPSRVGAAAASALALAFFVMFPISVWFVAGVAVRYLSDRRAFLPPGLSRALEVPALVACIVLGSLGHFSYNWGELGASWHLMALILASMTFYFYLAVSPGSLSGRALGGAVPLYLGTVSYSLYLVHPYTYYACRGAFRWLGLFTADVATSMTLFFLATVPVTLLATHLAHVALERAPYRWVFRQRIYRTRREGAPAGGGLGMSPAAGG